MNNPIAIARKAIKAAIKSGKICKEISGMHQVGMDAIAELCPNIELRSELAWEATKDVKLGR